MAYEFLIFDLDGTLTDPRDGFVSAVNDTLMHYGYAARSDESLLQYIGPPIDESFSHIAKTQDPALIQALVACYRERYAALGWRQNRLYDGIPEVLWKLHEGGQTLCVCTSKRRDFAEAILKMFGLHALFSFISGGDVGIPKYQQLSDLLERGVLSSDAVMIGDRDVDVTAARRNRLDAIGVLWGYGSREELESQQPRLLVEKPDQLLSVLSQ